MAEHFFFVAILACLRMKMLRCQLCATSALATIGVGLVLGPSTDMRHCALHSSYPYSSANSGYIRISVIAIEKLGHIGWYAFI